ncbi:NDP-sugar synthase [Caproiciproducens sp. NJN-50]|uniref:sugar phosphate nucleotidyltransferase n=1 Tax=Acutalibacteraceae TaxID=3082771 RepID=UPI000FFE15F2|nr:MULTISPECIES: NDP-sugar synthase [Acutalibacteraceae]QAT50342.1 NDP-sugar synthase [Caproiciproducens sp. NJN-50]
MKALFLAGGMGTRLKPLTDEIPKPMVPIMNRPLLERNMENLKKCGIREIVISTCYKSRYIREYFGDGSKFGLKIEYICEDLPLGTGGAIKKAGDLFDDTFLVFNADILCSMDFMELVTFHQSRSAAVTIAVTQVDNPSAYGVIEQDENGYATSFTEKPRAEEIRSNYINAGVYVMEPEVLRGIPEGRPVSVERETFPALLRSGSKVAVYKSGSYWMDIGTPEKYLQTHEDIMAGKCLIENLDFNNQSVIKDGKSMIDSTAKIIGPVYIGNHVKIGAYTTIGPDAVIGDHVWVHTGGSVADSILWDNVDIGTYAKLKGAVVASNCNVKDGTIHSDTAFTVSESVGW